MVSPTFVCPWGHALALSMTPVTTTWYDGRASTWLSYALPPPLLDGELLDGRQGGIHCCAVLAQPGDRRLYCPRPPLTTCPSRLLQMGGGACQAHEPADRGGHATGGKTPPTAWPEAHGRTMWPGAQSPGGQSGSFVLPPAASVSPQGSQRPLLRPLQGQHSVAEDLWSKSREAWVQVLPLPWLSG